MEVGVLGDEGGGEAEEQAEAHGPPEDAEEVGEGAVEFAAVADAARLEGVEEHDGHRVVEHAFPWSAGGGDERPPRDGEGAPLGMERETRAFVEGGWELQGMSLPKTRL